MINDLIWPTQAMGWDDLPSGKLTLFLMGLFGTIMGLLWDYYGIN